MGLRKLAIATTFSLLAANLFACGASNAGKTETTAATTTQAAAESSKEESKAGGEKLKIVATNFPAYDFARAVTKGEADVTMLVKPGAETHSYEPSPQDIITIQNADLFLYVGGDSDAWVDGMLKSMNKEDSSVFKMMDAVNLMEEETVEGMQEEEEHDHDHDHDHEKSGDHDHEEESGDHDHEDKASEAQSDSHEEEEVEMDEHVWTSPVNAIQIVKKLDEKISSLDSSKKDVFDKNTEAYVKELEELDKSFREVVDSGKRKEIIVADRFPFAYFCKEYGLTYFAAFPGCSTDTQPAAQTIAFLQDKVKEDGIPVVFHIEMSNEDMVNAICKDTGAKKMLLNAVHNVTDEDFKAGKTYVDLMKPNVEALKEALN